MAESTIQFPVIIITDSRGAGLQSLIDHQTQRYPCFQVRVLVYKGKGIVEAVELAKPKLAWWKPRIVVVLNGLCDVTLRDRQTKLVTLRYESEELMVNLYKEYMTTTYHQLQHYLGDGPNRIIFGPLIGIDLFKCNQRVINENHQASLNTLIHQLNIEINRFNEFNGSITPWLARDVHRNIKGRKKNRYQLLAEDGVHLSPEMRSKWVAELTSSLVKNYNEMNLE